MDLALLALLGLVSGGITTVTGLGGGIVLLLAAAVLFDPATALAITAPGLLVGNLHRLALFRRDLDRRAALAVAAGTLPGAFLGGLLAVELPEVVLRGLLLAATGAAVARAVVARRGGGEDRRPERPRRLWAVTPVSAVAGALTATAGGGGLLLPPTLLAIGLRGTAYLATCAAGATLMHVGRLTAYSAAGWMSADRWLLAGLLALTIPLGNLVGRAIRARLSTLVLERATYATLLTASGLAVLGLT